VRLFTVTTARPREVVDLTDRVNALVGEAGFRAGLCHLLLLHTTAALTLADLDPGTDLDILDALTEMVPRLRYRHPHNPAHVPNHILSALVGTSLTLPVADGRLVLGTWQRVVLIEFEGPRRREVAVTLVPSEL